MIGLALARWVLILAALLSLAGPALAAGPGVSQDTLTEKDGLYYAAGESAPFTGTAQQTGEGGRVIAERRYKAGRMEAAKVWYPGGNLAEETSFDGKTLTRKRWYPSGGPEETVVMVLNGPVKVSEKTTRYHENGKLALEAGYLGDTLHGRVREFDANGNVVVDETYDKGRLVTKK